MLEEEDNDDDDEEEEESMRSSTLRLRYWASRAQLSPPNALILLSHVTSIAPEGEIMQARPLEWEFLKEHTILPTVQWAHKK